MGLPVGIKVRIISQGCGEIKECDRSCIGCLGEVCASAGYMGKQDRYRLFFSRGKGPNNHYCAFSAKDFVPVNETEEFE